MATNITHEDNDQLLWTVGAGLTSGDPIVVGRVPGVCLTDADANNKAVLKTRGAATLTVEAVDSVPVTDAVAEGDVIYYDSAATIKLNKDSVNGVPFGIARAAIATGSAAIEVVIGTGTGTP